MSAPETQYHRENKERNSYSKLCLYILSLSVLSAEVSNMKPDSPSAAMCGRGVFLNSSGN